MIRRFATCLAILACLTGGCVELGALLGVALPDGATDGPAGGESNGDGQPPDSGGSDTAPVVRLAVSNPNPLTGEEVVFTCTLVDGDTEDVTFAFQSTADRLVVDSEAGTASYIVEQSDVAVELSATCTATNAAGTSEPSNRQVIIATQ
jgi:hypothetical protein